MAYVDLIYKCRRCGEIYIEDINYPADQERTHAVMWAMAGYDNDLDVWKSRNGDNNEFGDLYEGKILSVHQCHDEGCGISDFVGCSPAREPPGGSEIDFVAQRKRVKDVIDDVIRGKDAKRK